MNSTTTASSDMARSAREMAYVKPYAREWQEVLWEVVQSGRTANVTLRVTVTDGEVQQVQQVRDGVDKIVHREK